MSTTTTGPSSTTTSSSTTSSTTTTPPGITLPFPPTTTTSTSTSTTSSSSSTTATSSTSTNTSTTSTTTSTTTASTAVAVPPTQANSTTSTGIPAVITQVSTTFVSESNSPTASGLAVKSSTNNGFFSHKGAVAGVFAVVGLIGLAIIILLITNAVRRRRAHEFDKEVIAATREAAATAPNPHFLDDEEDGDRFKSGYGLGSYGNGGGTNGYNGNGGYSDVSHGTYGQAPMEVYNMRDMGGHGTAVGEIYDPYAAGGAAGIGVARARSTRLDNGNSNANTYAAALQEGGAPYAKFAIGPQETFNAGIISRGQQQQYSQQYPQLGSSQDYPVLGRAKSGSTIQHSTPSQPHVPASYQQPYPVRQMSPPQNSFVSSAGSPTPNFPNPQHPQPYQAHVASPSGGSTRDADDAEDDAYGGFVVDSPLAQAGGTKAYEDDEVVEAPKRVLKVANE